MGEERAQETLCSSEQAPVMELETEKKPYVKPQLVEQREIRSFCATDVLPG